MISSNDSLLQSERSVSSKVRWLVTKVQHFCSTRYHVWVSLEVLYFIISITCAMKSNAYNILHQWNTASETLTLQKGVLCIRPVLESMETQMCVAFLPIQHALCLQTGCMRLSCCSHTRWTVSRSAQKMSFCARTTPTASPNAGAVMMSLIVWTTAMRRTVDTVWKHSLSTCYANISANNNDFRHFKVRLD